jgi:hypothetical protein
MKILFVFLLSLIIYNNCYCNINESDTLKAYLYVQDTIIEDNDWYEINDINGDTLNPEYSNEYVEEFYGYVVYDDLKSDTSYYDCLWIKIGKKHIINYEIIFKTHNKIIVR